MSSRVAVVTGSSGGIGSATVEAFQAEGWSVVGLDRSDPKGGKAGPDRFLRVDFARPDEVQHAVHLLSGEAVHALVNNAALNLSSRLVDTSLDDWNMLLAVNVTASFLTTKGLLPALAAAQGAVVNVSSVHALATSVDVSAYATTKGALAALTRAAALELASHGVRVNAVLPGAVDTPMLRASIERVSPGDPEGGLRALAGRTPLGRVGAAVDVAQAIVFLADGARSGFITGQALVVDGGATTRLSTE